MNSVKFLNPAPQSREGVWLRTKQQKVTFLETAILLISLERISIYTFQIIL